MSENIKSLLSELRAALGTIYGDRLKGAYLFGSYARGEADDESDVDVLIVLDQYDYYGTEIDRTSELISTLSLKYGVSISRVFITERDWLRGDTYFLLNARQEAIPA